MSAEPERGESDKGAAALDPAALGSAIAAALASPDAPPLTLATVQAIAARVAVQVALQAAAGNRVRAAALLGASHRQIARYPR